MALWGPVAKVTEVTAPPNMSHWFHGLFSGWSRYSTFFPFGAHEHFWQPPLTLFVGRGWLVSEGTR